MYMMRILHNSLYKNSGASPTGRCAAVLFAFLVQKMRNYLSVSALRQWAQMFLPLKTVISLALSQKIQAG